ncbi:hypothetical protein RMATCC62417_10048 [Rhizopus microsporus]|nr:hypothetical protein RMATCC62417_10048 [Rhizopus microsporus]
MITSMLITQNPNRGQVFAASYGEGESFHQVRRCSTKEYYTYTGSKRHEKRERMSNEDMGNTLLSIPTAKTASISKYLLYVTYILLHFDKILAFNRFSTAKSRFHLYQGVQRAREEMVNILVNGGRKYSKSKKRRKKRKDKHPPKVNQKRKDPYWKKSDFFYDKEKLSLISFGNGMFGKDLVEPV